MRTGTNVVIDALVGKTQVLLPPFIEVRRLGAVTVEGFQNGEGISVGDWYRRDRRRAIIRG